MQTNFLTSSLITVRNSVAVSRAACESVGGPKNSGDALAQAPPPLPANLLSVAYPHTVTMPNVDDLR